jgi:hypothetical protein
LIGNSSPWHATGIIWGPKIGTTDLASFFPEPFRIDYRDISSSLRLACGSTGKFSQPGDEIQREAVLVSASSAPSDDSVLRLGVLAHEDLQADPDKGELRYQNSWAHRISQDGKVVIGFSLTHVVPGSGGDFRQRIELFRWTAETGMIGLGLMPGQTDHNLFQYLEVTDIGQNGSVSCGIADMTFNGVTKRYPWLWTEEEGLEYKSPHGPIWTASHGAPKISQNGKSLAGNLTTPISPVKQDCFGSDVVVETGYLWDLTQNNREGLRWIPTTEEEVRVRIADVSNDGALLATAERLCEFELGGPPIPVPPTLREFFHWKPEGERIDLVNLVEPLFDGEREGWRMFSVLDLSDEGSLYPTSPGSDTLKNRVRLSGWAGDRLDGNRSVTFVLDLTQLLENQSQ